MPQVSKSARSHRKHNDDRELYQGKRRLIEEAIEKESLECTHSFKPIRNTSQVPLLKCERCGVEVWKGMK